MIRWIAALLLIAPATPVSAATLTVEQAKVTVNERDLLPN